MKLYSMDMAMMKKMMPITMAMAEICRSRLSGRLEQRGTDQVDELGDLPVDGGLARVEGGDQAGDTAHHGGVARLDNHSLYSGWRMENRQCGHLSLPLNDVSGVEGEVLGLEVVGVLARVGLEGDLDNRSVKVKVVFIPRHSPR